MPDWYQELLALFQQKYSEETEQAGGLLPPLFSDVVGEALGSGPDEVDVLHVVEIGGTTGFLFVRGDTAWFAVFESPEVCEMRFLGDLRGGRYRERTERANGVDQVEATYEHPRLGAGETLTALISSKPASGQEYVSGRTRNAEQRGRALRAKLTGWSRHDVSDPGVT